MPLFKKLRVWVEETKLIGHLGQVSEKVLEF